MNRQPSIARRAHWFARAIVFLALAHAWACGEGLFVLSNERQLETFTFRAADNPGLSADVTATIVGDQITAQVPLNINPTALVASFNAPGARVLVNGQVQASGQSAQDFLSPVTYEVRAADETASFYTVVVMPDNQPGPDIVAFAFFAANNPGLPTNVSGMINGTTITAFAPPGTDVGNLVATFETTGTEVRVGGVPQVSGVTGNNFTTPVAYDVIGANGVIRTYSVDVVVPTGADKDLVGFAFLTINNPQLGGDAFGEISGTTIVVNVPSGTDLTSLVADFATTGVGVAIGPTPQTSGFTVNDFSGPVTYTVIAADSSTKTYTVIVNLQGGSAKEIVGFAFLTINNPQLPIDVFGEITGTTITVNVPGGTDVMALVADFATTGVAVDVGPTPQVSGFTVNDFSGPVIYTVTAADTSTQNYTVIVNVAGGSDKDILGFAFLAMNNPQLPFDAIGVITGNTINVEVPSGTDLSTLVADFASTGVGVTIGATPQQSGITVNDFNLPLTYTVTAADTSTQDYEVVVSVGNQALLTSFDFLVSNNPGLPADAFGTINPDNTVIIALPVGTDVTALVASFTHDGIEILVDGMPQTSDVSVHDFTAPIIYDVISPSFSSNPYLTIVVLE